MKYKYNNEWKEMNVKVSDTLPIGSIVDYDGETVPSGYEQVANSGSNENGVMRIKKVYQPVASVGQIINENSNSTKDTYSCDYINQDNNYSTQETKTNKLWIDGKPIYKKVINNITISLDNNQQIINHNISNFKNLTSLKFYVSYSGTTFDLLSSGYIVRVTDTTIQITLMAQGINLGGYSGYAIIEYTKTND